MTIPDLIQLIGLMVAIAFVGLLVWAGVERVRK